MAELFKLNDRVYCPMLGTGCYIIQSGAKRGELAIYFQDRELILTPAVLGTEEGSLPALFAANPENKAKLEAFYGISFVEWSNESAYLNELLKNHTDVLAFVSNDPTNIKYDWDEGESIIVAIYFCAADGSFLSRDGNSWLKARALTDGEISGLMVGRKEKP